MTDDKRERSHGVALIRRMAGRDRQAFSEFYDRYARFAFSLIRRILGQPAEAEEVLQEVFWQVWLDARTYDERRGSPEAWLLNRARSRAIDKLRSIRRRGESPVGLLDDRASGGLPGTMPNPVSQTEAQGMVRSALAGLPDPQREVIALAFYEGLTQSEIALRLKEPLGTIKSRMRAALERLRHRLREETHGSA